MLPSHHVPLAPIGKSPAAAAPSAAAPPCDVSERPLRGYAASAGPYAAPPPAPAGERPLRYTAAGPSTAPPPLCPPPLCPPPLRPPPLPAPTEVRGGQLKPLRQSTSAVSFQAEPAAPWPPELEQTSEIRRSYSKSSRPLDGLSRSSSMTGLSRNTSFAGGQLPIMLPGKLQWVRDKHLQMNTLSKLKGPSTGLSSLGVNSLPSEMFFGHYDEGLNYSSRASIMRSTARLGPLAEDSFFARANPQQRVAREKKGNWSLYSFDRMAEHFHSL